MSLQGNQDAPARAIVADIGGTNARFAVADLATLALSDFQSVSCAEHASIVEAATAYAKSLANPPAKAAFAIAAPVTGDTVDFTNSPWSFERKSLAKAMGLDGLLVLNDFQALAMSLPYIADADLTQIGGTAPVEKATKLVLGPGTGLGTAGLVWSEAGWVAVPGEGGHINLAPVHLGHLSLLQRMMGDREHLSAERVISGLGICDLYRSVAAEHGREAEPLEARDIVERATAKTDEIAVETLEHFVAWLGSFAGDAALMLGARGGVYLGGGIPVRILDILKEGDFRRHFEAKGRMREAFLASIPIYVIGAEAPALQGAAAALREAVSRNDDDLIGVD
ncbi:Glucokinase [Methyloligella halotolerans]|uniref:Glucokinase n=1 Tax=Methyloligella halotolerans TaxID=1177755 RepID=A0A1E2RX15_9HYPH|nr:glucokinase [Methyloligella halotolerans]ODA66638.1 Glucokinase [Methyloligella halotolerans]